MQNYLNFFQSSLFQAINGIQIRIFSWKTEKTRKKMWLFSLIRIFLMKILILFLYRPYNQIKMINNHKYKNFALAENIQLPKHQITLSDPKLNYTKKKSNTVLPEQCLKKANKLKSYLSNLKCQIAKLENSSKQRLFTLQKIGKISNKYRVSINKIILCNRQQFPLTKQFLSSIKKREGLPKKKRFKTIATQRIKNSQQIKNLYEFSQKSEDKNIGKSKQKQVKNFFPLLKKRTRKIENAEKSVDVIVHKKYSVPLAIKYQSLRKNSNKMINQNYNSMISLIHRDS